MRRLVILGLLLVGCSAPEHASPSVSTGSVPHSRIVPAPSLESAARIPDDQVALDAVDEQISAQTMFCTGATDCPSGFACDDGACVARP
jgi:hypothetical protein